MEITKAIAQRIIESRPVIDEMLTPFKGVEVSNVGFKDADGDAFEWEDGTEYAIVSFKAMSEYHFDRASEDFDNEDYTDACNHNLSLSVEATKARELIGSTGVLVCHKIENKDGEMIVVVKSFKAVPAENASSKLRTLGGKGKKDGKKSKIALAENDEVSFDDMRVALIKGGASKKDVKALSDKKVAKAYAEL